MARIFVNPEMIEGDTVRITDKGDVHHITRVLRLGAGDTIDVSDKTQFEYTCEIIAADSSIILAKVIEKRGFTREPRVRVTLFQGIPKAGKMESIVQKCVELGIYEIVPVWTERTVVTDKGNFGKKIERWQKVADEAVKQCRRGIIPRIAPDIKLKDALGACGSSPDAKNVFENYDLVMLAYEGEEKQSIKDCLEAVNRGDTASDERRTGMQEENKAAAAPAPKQNPESIAMIIGPEGGFSDAEAEFLTKAGTHSVTLGKTILRTETAGPAMLAMIMYALEL